MDGGDVMEEDSDAPDKPPVDTAAEEGEDAGGSGAWRVWHDVAHAGAINCIATHDDLVATASR